MKKLVIRNSGVMLVSFLLCWLIKDAQVKQLDEDFSYFSLAQKTIRFVKEDRRQLLLVPITFFSGDSRYYLFTENFDLPKSMIYRNWWLTETFEYRFIRLTEFSRKLCLLYCWNIHIFFHNMWIWSWMDWLDNDCFWNNRNHNKYFTWLSEI